MLDASQTHTRFPTLPHREKTAVALVASDDIDARTSIACALRYAEYHVLLAANGADALDELGSGLASTPPRLPDLLVVDLVHDNLTCMHLLAALRSAAPGLPVVVIAPRENHARARELGAAAVLVRPVGLIPLLAALSGLQAPPPDDLATIVYDLRNPLHVIALESRLLGSWVTDPSASVTRTLDRIQHNIAFMDRLIGELIDAVQLSEGLAIERHPTELAALVEEVVDRSVATADRERVRIEVCDRMTVLGDELRLQRVVENLVTNALKYGAAPAPVLVRIEQRGTHACVSVIDTGPGLTRDEATAVFEKYRRGSSSARGTGLGLYVSRKIVEAHGGRLVVESTRGAGSQFRVELPVRIDS